MSLNPNLYSILSEASEPSQVTAQYVWGARPGHRDELILRDRATSGGGTLDERLYCLMDYFDPTAVIDPAGAVVERYGWSAFGQRRVMDADWEPLASSAMAFDFGFHGQFLDSETGYYNYGYRYYSSEAGRWLSRDPIGESGGRNLYSFTGNSAPNHMDIYGLRFILEYGTLSAESDLLGFTKFWVTLEGTDEVRVRWPEFDPRQETLDDEIIESEGGTCAFVKTAALIDIRALVETLDPVRADQKLTNSGRSEVEGHEHRWVDAVRRGYFNYLVDIQGVRPYAIKCGKIKRDGAGEAKRLLGEYLKDLRQEAWEAFNEYRRIQFAGISEENMNQHWIDGRFDHFTMKHEVENPDLKWSPQTKCPQ